MPNGDNTKAPDFGMRRSTRRQLASATASLAKRVNRLTHKLKSGAKVEAKPTKHPDIETQLAANSVIFDMGRLSLSVETLLKKLHVK